MNYNKESFCPEVWSQIEVDAEGDFKICCLANYDSDFGMARDENDQVMNIMTHSFEEAINSKTHKEHRVELSKNIQPRRCRNCYDSEESTKGIKEWGYRSEAGVSKRQRVLRNTSILIPEYVNIETAKEITDSDGTISNPKIINLDLRFGNLCNQKCIMCSPQHSNLWYDDWVSIGYYGNPEYNRDKSVYKKGKYKIYPIVQDERGKFKMQGAIPWWESDIWWKKFDEIAPQLRYIYFTGGEPLIVPAMQECLDRLIKNDFAKNISLRYDTNLSVINKKVIDKWKYFKELFLCVSIDDTNSRYNLIRNPGNYDKVIQNINSLRENNIPIHYISTCIGIASIYSMPRILELADKLNVETNFRYLEGPNWLDIRNLPKSAKLEIIENLKKYQNNPVWKRWILSQIRLLEKYIEFENLKYIQEFVRVMNILDNTRGTNWKSTLDDVFDLIVNHCPTINLDSN